MSFCLGLTGSIGMGKSTTAEMFARHGCALWDADAAVHRAYSAGGRAVVPMGEAFPEAIRDGAVSREALRELIGINAIILKEIEKIVHPLIQADRASFIASSTADIAVFDIPLLFETGAQDEMDAVACVNIPKNIQRQRVLARNTMTEAQFEAVLAKQMPNDEKCARSDFVIVTDTFENTERQVLEIVDEIRERLRDA